MEIEKTDLVGLRARAGKSQGDVAKELGCSPGSVSRMERRVREGKAVEWGTLKKYLDALGVPWHLLIERKGDQWVELVI